MVIPQAQPVRVIFLGDFLDRYNFGYHIIQLVEKIRWETYGSYDRRISNFNLFIKKTDENNREILPIDWRVISLIWRHHYGNFFRRTRLLHSEGATIFVHGGISPLALVDPLVFGNIYEFRGDTFKLTKRLKKALIDLGYMVKKEKE